VAFMVLNMD